MKNLAGDSQKSPPKQYQFLAENKISLLEKALNHFISSTNLTPKIGIELEFYLLEKNGDSLENKDLVQEFIAELAQKFPSKIIYKIEKEQGRGQIEIKTIFDSDLLKICAEIEKVKSIAKELAEKKNLLASFAAQPFEDDCGSALQFNISLHDKNSENLFLKKERIFYNSISALLQFTDAMLIILAPKKEDYLRFDHDLNRKLHKNGKYPAPINLSFGGENRTCAIRVPVIRETLSEIKYGARIEYRIAASNADIYLAMIGILNAILRGIENNLELCELGFEQIYGNAFEQQYNLKSFAKSYERAEENFLMELFV